MKTRDYRRGDVYTVKANPAWGCPNGEVFQIMIIQNDAKINSIIDNSLINPILCINDEQSLNKVVTQYQCSNVNCYEE